MLGTTFLEQTALEAAIASTDLFSSTDGIKVRLVKTAINPAPDLTYDDLEPDLCDFDGSTPKAPDTTEAELLQEPGTKDWLLRLREAAGGWSWKTTGLTNLPQTVNAVIVYIDATDKVLLGSERLPAEIILTAVDQVVDVGHLWFRLGQGFFGE